MSNSKLKVAVFYDWLNQWGGAERVLLNILKIYPDADVFTLVYSPKAAKWLPKHLKIHTSLINKLPFSARNPLVYTPLYPLALEQFNFANYDIVISTTSTVGHSLLTLPHTLFVCYAHNINRYLYQTPSRFRFLRPLLRSYQQIDTIYAQRPSHYFTNSRTVHDRIKTNYNRDSIIISPGIDTDKFTPSANPPSDYYLVVSRLVDHKRIDLAIDACHRLNLKLFVVGQGRNAPQIIKYIQSLGDSHIKFLGAVSDSRLVDLYQHCQALICPQEEDFGLTPLEAQACGRPIIAYNKGGLTETVIDGKTGIFFDSQTVDSLTEALTTFKETAINTHDCRTQALKFSDELFMLHFKQQIDQLWQNTHPQTITS